VVFGRILVKVKCFYSWCMKQLLKIAVGFLWGHLYWLRSQQKGTVRVCSTQFATCNLFHLRWHDIRLGLASASNVYGTKSHHAKIPKRNLGNLWFGLHAWTADCFGCFTSLPICQQMLRHVKIDQACSSLLLYSTFKSYILQLKGSG